MSKVMFTETVLRDANQSLIATRMPFSTFEPILQALENAGFYSLECWGGATFDSCLRYLSEDPWERLRKIKSVCKKTKLQMLLRGQNLLGYKHYPDDVVRTFVQRSVENGISEIRIFDALNDMRNLETAVKETIKMKAEAQVAISYTTSPVHSIERYIKDIRDIEAMGATALCIKDMAGVMSPKEAYELVKGIKENSKLRLHIHTHCTTGLAYMTLLKSIEAGADVIDTATSVFSGGTSQASTQTMAYTLKQLGYQVDLDDKCLKEINDFFKPYRAQTLKDGLLNPVVMGTDADALIYQIPGGMLSNLVAQLTAQKKLDKLADVLEETPKVRKDMGYPPLVTPLSQMVGVQAVNNVLSGERYKSVSKEIRAYLLGEYGRPPGDIDQGLIKKVLGDEKPMTGRFADTLAPGMEQGKKDSEPLGARNVDDYLSYILFPPIAEKFFADRAAREENKCKYTIQKVEE